MGRSAAVQHPDYEVVQAFAESHPDVYGGLWFVESQMHVGLTVMRPHAAVLRAQLHNPALVTIRPVRFTAVEVAAVRVEVELLVRGSGMTWHSLGADIQAATVDLGPDAVVLARELHGRFGDRVRVTVGGRVYPPDGKAVPAPAAPVATREIPGLKLLAMLDNSSVATGQRINGFVQLVNVGRTPIRFDTDQPLAALVIDTAGRVAGTFSGWMGGTGQIVDLAPGASQEIPLIGGTAGGSGEQYSTPPGSYTVIVPIPIRSAPHGELLTPPIPLEVTAAATPLSE